MRAARLFGTAEALRETVGHQQDPGERVPRDPHLNAARSRLGEAAWDAAFAEGRAMNLEDTLAHAIEGPEVRGEPASS